MIPVAFDFTCPQVWIGWNIARRLEQEYDVEFDWLPYILWPEEIPWPEARPATTIPGRPPVPSRFELQCWAERLEVPPGYAIRPTRMRAHLPLEAVAFLREKQPESVRAFVDAAMEAYWLGGDAIGNLDVVLKLAAEVPNLGSTDTLNELQQALETRTYKGKVVHFDADAFKNGVWNVPTFWIGGERYAEQPYAVLAAALTADGVERKTAIAPLYSDISFPSTQEKRPYVFIDMVTTIDGKILTGERDEHVVDLGSKFDHQVMQNLEFQADAVLVGAGTLRASKRSWTPRAPLHVVLSGSGHLDFDHHFFDKGAAVATASASHFDLPNRVEHIEAGVDQVHLPLLLQKLYELGVRKLLVLGGSTLNAQLLEKDLVDELFLTLAPKVKLGRDVPTYAGGNPLPREKVQNYEIVEHHRVGEEIFLRYRRKR